MVVITILLLFILFLAGFLHIYLSVPSKKLYSKLHSFLIANSNNSSSSSSSSSNLAKSTTTKKQEIITNSSSCGKKGEDLKGVFATFDKNGDGFITKQELSESLNNIRIFMSEKEVEEMMVKLDSNGDGLIDFEEFCILCKAMGSSGGSDGNYEEEVGVEKGSEDEELKEAFDVFDKDKDGMISVEELGSVLSCLGLNEGKRLVDCKEMIKKVDMDGDGMVNFDEFKMMMKGNFGCNGGNDNRQVSVF